MIGSAVDERPEAAGEPAAATGRGLWWWLAPVLVATISTAVLHLVERTARIVAPQLWPDGYRFQDWQSNWLMQTLGLEEMIPFGPKALWYNHIYPPLLDGIRYVFTFPETSAGLPVSAMAVDFRLYALYAVFFGLVNAMLFIWVRNLTRNAWWAVVVTIGWAISPGYITLMTLLDPSPLAMTTITASWLLLFYFLKTRHLGFATAFFGAFLLASLSRTVTQWHVLIVLWIAVVAFWFMAKRRNALLLVLNAVLVGLMMVIPIKQYVMYATTDVTSFGGYHRAGMLWIDPRTVPEPEYPQHMIDNALAFSSRFNTQEQVKDNYRLGLAANAFIREHPVEAVQRLAKSLTVTVPEMMRSTSYYTQNYLVEKIPWRAPMDWLFSGWPYLLMIIGSLAMIVLTRGWRGAWRLVRCYGWLGVFWALVGVTVIWSNRFWPGQEDAGAVQTDAIRQKMFLEIPIVVIVAYGMWLAARRWIAPRLKGSGRKGASLPS